MAQAAALARRIAGLAVPVDVVLSSPLARCVRTAEAIAAAAHSGPVVIEPDLVECDFGDWEGLTFAEVRERYPDDLAAWLGSTAVAPPGGESFRDVAERVRRVVAEVSNTLRDSGERSRSRSVAEVSTPHRNSGRTVVLVSHVSPIKLILRDALAATDAFLHRCYLDAAGISTVDTWSDGGVAVRSVNDTAHLAATAVPATAGRGR